MLSSIVARYTLKLAQEGPGQSSSESKGGGVPPQWNEWLKAEHQGGKEKVSNPSQDTKSRFPQVSYSTALKDKAFRERAMKEYKDWVKDQDDGGKGKKEAPKEKAKPKGTPITKGGDKKVGNVTYTSQLTGAAAEKTVKAVFGDKPPSMEDIHGMFSIGGNLPTQVVMQLGPDGKTVKATLSIKDGGKEVGTVIREFSRNAKGALEVNQELFKLDASLQGKGTGKKVLQNSLDGYKKLGVAKITQDCAWVGRYTWARMGYSLSGTTTKEKLASLPADIRAKAQKLLKDVQEGDVDFDDAMNQVEEFPDEHFKTVQDIVSEVEDDSTMDYLRGQLAEYMGKKKYPVAIRKQLNQITELHQLADLHVEHEGKMVHVGKEFLLNDDPEAGGIIYSYKAHLNLDDDDPGYKRMQKYLGGKD